MKLLFYNILTLIFLITLEVPLWASSSHEFQVDVILAQKEGASVDPRLEKLQKKLKNIFQFSGYRLISRQSIKAPINAESIVNLPQSGKLIIKPIATTASGVLIVEIKIRGTHRPIHSQVRLRRGGTLILSGPATGEGPTILGLSLNS